MKNRRNLFLLIVLLTAAIVSADGQDWNQWRGPQRDGSVAAAFVPQAWPASYKTAWETEIGEGYSSPVVDATTAYVHSRMDPDEIVTAVDLQSGKPNWSQKYLAKFDKNQYAKEMAKGPNATPLISEGRLFTIGVTGMLTAWDAASGTQLWRNDYSGIVDTSKLFCGTSASPLLVDNHLIVHVGSDVHGGQILALNPEDGSEAWKWKGTGPGYASPIVCELGGQKQIVTLTDSSILGLDAKTGQELWTIPFPDEWQENIVTPLWTGELLVISGTRQGTHAYRLEVAGGKWKGTQVWENREVAMYMSSPVLGDGLVYGHSSRRKGQFVALDAKTGALKWASPGRDGEFASVLLTPQFVVLLNDNARLIVADRGSKEFHAHKSYQLTDKKTWSMPVLLGDDLLFRDEGRLVRMSAQH
jgi:outer membrane protein assembly factor BamB